METILIERGVAVILEWGEFYSSLGVLRGYKGELGEMEDSYEIDR